LASELHWANTLQHCAAFENVVGKGGLGTYVVMSVFVDNDELVDVDDDVVVVIEDEVVIGDAVTNGPLLHTFPIDEQVAVWSWEQTE
jgi:hypothetical protein